MSSYLKKYTKLEYLLGILKNKSLHLGRPQTWPDKNDAYAIQLAGWKDPLVTCLTESDDRYHFWEVFGEHDKGVCLYFSNHSLRRDIEKDRTLIVENVCYPKKKDMEKALKKVRSPAFIKREQYADEREVRVIRAAPQGSGNNGFLFSSASLQKIYLNPWIDKEQCACWKSMLQRKLEEFGYSGVEVKQNRSTDFLEWKKRLKNAVGAVPRC